MREIFRFMGTGLLSCFLRAVDGDDCDIVCIVKLYFESCLMGVENCCLAYLMAMTLVVMTKEE